MNPKIKALIFDCDGTLADNMPIHYQSWCQTLNPYKIKFSKERFYSLAGVPTTEIIQLLADEQNIKISDINKVSLEKDDAYHALEESVEPIHEVVEIARKYQGILKMSVGSGSTQVSVEATLKHLKISDFFDHLICKDKVKQPKPHPETFLLAAELMGVDPANCVVFEDGQAGIQAAKKAGMFFVDIINEAPDEKLLSF